MVSKIDNTIKYKTRTVFRLYRLKNSWSLCASSWYCFRMPFAVASASMFALTRWTVPLYLRSALRSPRKQPTITDRWKGNMYEVHLNVFLPSRTMDTFSVIPAPWLYVGFRRDLEKKSWGNWRVALIWYVYCGNNVNAGFKLTLPYVAVQTLPMRPIFSAACQNLVKTTSHITSSANLHDSLPHFSQ